MILHIVRRGDWDDAVGRGSYAPESLRGEGFIHCSTPAQVIDTANRFYRGQRDLIVLCIEESRVTAEVRYEAPAGDRIDDQLFPHLYGELNIEAVVRVIELVWEENRGFRMAREIQV